MRNYSDIAAVNDNPAECVERCLFPLVMDRCHSDTVEHWGSFRETEL